MKLVSFSTAGPDAMDGWSPGVLVDGDRVVDLTAGTVEGGFSGVREILEGGASALERARELSQSASASFALADITLGPPVPDPDKVICIGLNYREHAGEVDMEMPAAPILFPKFRNSLVGDGADIVMPDLTDVAATTKASSRSSSGTVARRSPSPTHST